MQARWAIFRIMMENGVVAVDFTPPTVEDPKGNLALHLDRTKLDVAKKAVGHFLCQLNVYKATADIERGGKNYVDACKVVGDHLKWRDVVLAHKQPRKEFVQPVTKEVDGAVELLEFTPSPAGMVPPLDQ